MVYIKNKINANKVTVNRVGYFGVESSRVMPVIEAVAYVEDRNTFLVNRGINNNKNFQTYLTIAPYYGK